MSSTFGTFGTARLGIYAAQKGLDVTGNNITNINTPGHTRQRLDQVSLVNSAADKFDAPGRTRVGQGVLTTGVSQLRDPGLDLLYRGAQSNAAAADQKLAGLESLARVLDEVGKGDGEQDDGVLLSQLNDLRDLISKAVTNGIDGYDSLIRSSANSLCQLFNQYAGDLSDLAVTYEQYLDQDLAKVNTLLTNLQELNVSIRNADIRGDDALELRDQRNLLLDQLSGFAKIDVRYTTEDVGAGLLVEKLTVSLSTGSRGTLIDGEFAAQLSREADDPSYTLQLHTLRDRDGQAKDPAAPESRALDNRDLYGSLQSLRELLTGSGEYTAQGQVAGDPDAAVRRGIPYYQKALDSLAFEFAEQMNRLNTPAADLAGKGPLFSTGSNTDATDGITAANLSVSRSWADGTVSMVAAGSPEAASGDTSHLAAFLALFGEKQAFDPNDITGGTGDGAATGAVWNGTFEEMLLKIQSTLAEEQMTTTAVLDNYAATAGELYTDRDSVSGVDLNDEAANLMIYQKAYTASCRLMTVLEEALDSLLAM